MINPIDRTDEFLRALRAQHKVTSDTAAVTVEHKKLSLSASTSATSAGGDAASTTSSTASDAFTQQAQELLRQVQGSLQSLRKSQDRYHDFSARGMTDAERDDVDSAVARLLESALKQVDRLKREAVEQLAQLARGGGGGDGDDGGSSAAHKLGVVAIINDDLTQVSAISERMRAGRVRQAISDRERARVKYDAAAARELAEERRLSKRAAASTSATSGVSNRDGHSDNDGAGRDGAGSDGYDGNAAETAAAIDDAGGVGGGDMQLGGVLEQEFARENATLVNDLVQTRERVREAERTVYAIANMNQIFATKVVEQGREIETLYDLAVEATDFAERGNRELRKMHQRGPIAKYVLAGMAVLLALTLLFFEWIGRKTRIL